MGPCSDILILGHEHLCDCIIIHLFMNNEPHNYYLCKVNNVKFCLGFVTKVLIQLSVFLPVFSPQWPVPIVLQLL